MVLNPCIRRIREGLGWSAYKLAKEAGISRSRLKSIEQGSNMSLNTFVKILHALGVTEAVLTVTSRGFEISLDSRSRVRSVAETGASGKKGTRDRR